MKQRCKFASPSTSDEIFATFVDTCKKKIQHFWSKGTLRATYEEFLGSQPLSTDSSIHDTKNIFDKCFADCHKCCFKKKKIITVQILYSMCIYMCGIALWTVCRCYNSHFRRIDTQSLAFFMKIQKAAGRDKFKIL